MPLFQSDTIKNALVRYLAAIGLAVLAQAARIPIHPPTRVPFITYVPFILASAWFGLRPALVSTALCILECDYFAVEPLHSFLIVGQTNWIGAMFLGVTGMVAGSLVAALRRSRKKFDELHRKTESILEGASDGVVMLDREWRYAYVNRAASRLLGSAPEDLLGENLWELWPRAADTSIGEALRRAVAENVPVQAESYYPEPLNAWFECRGYPSPDGLLLFFSNIEERRKGEQTAGLLSAIVESSEDAIFSRDLDGVILSWNHGAERLTGYAAKEAIGQSLYAFFPVDRTADYQQVVARLRAGQNVAPFETERVRKDGVRIWVSVTVSPLWHAGKLVGASMIDHDITERRNTEQALALSEERYRSLVTVSNQIVWVIGPDGIVDDMPMWRDFSGQSAAEVRGWGWLNALHPDDRDRTVEIWLRAVKSRCFYDTEYRIRRKDGLYRDMAVHGVPVTDNQGNIREWVGSCADITERKAAEEALRESRATLSAALESMTDGLFISDASGRLVEFNEAFAKYQRFPSKSACFQKFSDYPAILEVSFADGSPAPLDMWAVPRALRGETVREAEYILRRKDTGESWVGSYSFGPIRDKEGLVVGSVVVCRDITGRKRAESALQHSEQRFRQIFDNAPLGLCIVGGDGRIEHCNPALCGLTGYSAEELRGVWFGTLITPEDRAALAHASQIQAEKLSGAEFRCLCRDGRTVWVQQSASALIDNDEAARVLVILTDITDRKRAEEAGLERERTLRRFTEDAPVAIAIFDSEMRYLAASQRYRDEYHLGNQELAGRSHYEVFPEIQDGWREIHRRCLAGAVERNTAELFAQADGSARWQRWEIQPWVQTGGCIGGIVLFTEDVTEQKRAAEALLESEEQFHTLANAIPQLCWIAKGDGWIYWYNQRWYEYTGTTPEQMEGWGWQSVHDAAVLPSALSAWKASIASGEPFEMVLPLRAADGAFHSFLTRVAPLRDQGGKVVRWFGTNTDITKQQKAQEVLREVSEYRRLALEAGSLGFWDYQFQTGQVSWDQKCREMFGLSGADRDDYDTATSRIHADDRGAVEEAIQQALAGANQGAYHPEFRVVWPDGSVHWLVSHGRVYFESREGQSVAVRFLGVNLDITDVKRAHQAIQTLNLELEARVAERTAQLQAANRELEAFTYSVSHDLRAPLRAIDGFSRILLEEHAQEVNAEALRCLDVIRRNTLKMGALIDDLLAFSRLSRQPLNKRTVDVSALARQVCEELRTIEELRSDDKDRSIEVTIGDLPPCQADPALLNQVLVNLISNALKYSRARNPAKIEIGALRAATGSDTVYFVRDNGVGFDMRYVGKLFGVFERLHASEEYEGTGVGLALVQRIVARHGGRAWAEGAMDRGAVFYFTTTATSPGV
jgi:PAS domain S-box-containing protein